MSRLPVVAAVPNYNMGEELAQLLPQLMAQDYSDIYVLDDASTDNSRDVVENFGQKVHFVAGSENKGAAANRNRIIGALAGHKALIHFIDADSILETDDVIEKIYTMVPQELVGFVGGLVINTNGMQDVWNYGPRQSLRASIGAQVQARIERMLLTNPHKAAMIRKYFYHLIADRPDPLNPDVRHSVFWCRENNLIIQSEVFSHVGGFDEALREHEIQDLAIRLNNLGFERFFDPLLTVRHVATNVRGYNRNRAMARAEFYIARKHGVLKWIFG